ncbi:MAG: D-tyrosyl-tRNA(Tyr) deacylase [Bacteroidales bacterium]|nr:D-tyrosyl-tRNA(Tyr) deacylase [Bacteroidales bacterium]
MKIVVQRVSEASVKVEGKIIGKIDTGLLIFIGIIAEDTQEDIDWLVNKIVNLRIFHDSDGIMNLSLKDVDGNILAISQFTLHASTKKGNRPSYIYAARPEIAKPLYDAFVNTAKTVLGKPVQTGVFGADMKVNLVNEGPVTIIIDSKNRL